MYTHIHIYITYTAICAHLYTKKWTIKNQLYQLEIPLHPEQNVP